MQFSTLDLHPTLQANLKRLGFLDLTPIQLQAIPAALDGRDILALAPTGTGKTAAYVIPLLHRLLSTSAPALILTPTRALALQVYQFILGLTQGTKLSPTLLVGGASTSLQATQLKANSQLLIGTPGRVAYFAQLKLIPSTQFLVLDQVDRMLDLGFKADLSTLVRGYTSKPQTLLFSATLPSSLQPFAQALVSDPLQLDLSTADRLASTIVEQALHPKSLAQKQTLLLQLLRSHPGNKLIFANRKCDVIALARFLNTNHLHAHVFHGDLSQGQRIAVLKRFLRGQFAILVCTDLASRGLDVPNLTCVINYQLPACAHDYMHRVGRTGRNGAPGLAINLLSPADQTAWAAIERFRSTNITSAYVKKKQTFKPKSSRHFFKKQSSSSHSKKPFSKFSKK